MTPDSKHLPIVRTKLHRPPVIADLVCRKRLHERLDQAIQTPLALVSAPAGYGKSMLVSHWVESRDEPCAWLSLDQTDSDLRSFLMYFVSAVETVSPGACARTLAFLEAPGLPPIRDLAGHLLNELDAIDHACVLVLDDYHRIDHSSSVHELIGLLLAHPPRRVHLVIATRRDPPLRLASLRADNQIAEVRLRDLQFTGPEAAELLAATAGIVIGEDALENVQNEIEGWAVGLHLLSLALRGAKDPDALLGSIRGGVQYTEEYLLQEVLSGLAPEVRDCMLKSSLLDRFCSELLDAVCLPGEASSPSGLGGREIVDSLRRDGLFIIALDPQAKWSRYHHAFQSSLQTQLRRDHAPEEIADMHARASVWFESNGLVEEALEHALAAKDVERAAQIVERNRQSALNEDRWYALEQWLALLPEPVVQERADLLISRAWILVHHFRFEIAMPLLDEIEPLLGDDPAQKPLRGEVALLRGYILFFLGEGAGSLKYIEEALELIPVSFYEARAQSEVIFALSSQMEGRTEEALRGLDDLLLAYRTPSDLRKTRLVITQVFIHILSGDLREAETSNRRLREVAEGGQYAYATAWTEYLQGLIHLYRCELDAAVEHLGRSVSQRFIHFKRAAVDSIAALMIAYQVQGRGDEAQATRQLLRDYVASLDDPGLWTLVSSAEARLAIMEGQPEPALRWLESGPLPPEVAMIWWMDVPSVTRCRALIAQGSRTSLEEAEKGLRECVQRNEAHHNTYQLIEILALLSMVTEKQGKAGEALTTLDRAMTLAQPGRFVLPFLELGPPMAELLRKFPEERENAAYADRILSAYEETTTPQAAIASSGAEGPSVPGYGEPGADAETDLDPLTEREIDILELLAQRLRNKEIADRLLISTNTVNDHLKHIYQKLGVHGRRQAVRRATELGVLNSDSRD